MLNCFLDNSSKVNKIIHNIIVNTEANTTKINPPIDLHQGDTDTQVLFFQLRNNKKKYISIDSDYTAKIEFYNSVTKSLVSSDDVTIENRYRGQLSYVVGDTVIGQYGRYTTYLKLYRGDSEVYSISFVVVVAKNHSYSPKSNEVVMTKDFYDTLNAHMDNQEIHVGTEDRDFLDTFNDKIEDLNDLLAIGLHVDSELSTESTNPVENRVITNEIIDKEDFSNKVEEIDYDEPDIDLLKEQYPSVYASLMDKIISIYDEHGELIDDLQSPKNVTGNAMVEFWDYVYNQVSKLPEHRNLWQTSSGRYYVNGKFNIAFEQSYGLDGGTYLIDLSNNVISGNTGIYVATVLPGNEQIGYTFILGLYDDITSEASVFNILTSADLYPSSGQGIISDETAFSSLYSNEHFQDKADKVTSISNNPNNTNYPTEKAVADAIGDAITSVYRYKGSVASYANLPVSGNVVGDVWDVQDTGTNYAWNGTTWDSLSSVIAESLTNKVSAITNADKTSEVKYPNVKAVVDYFEDNLEIKSVVGTIENPIHTWELDDGLYWLSGEIFINLRVNFTGVSKPMLAYKRGLLIWIPSQNVWYNMRHYDTDNAVTGFVESTRVLREMPAIPSAQSRNILTDYAVKNYVDNLISAINGGSY